MRIMSNKRVVCVMTSINSPTKAMLGWSALWELIVVPDKKTPIHTYEVSKIELLPQSLTHGLDSIKHNHYSRKMIGYLEALTRSADIIIDTDDDTYPSSLDGILDHLNHDQRIVIDENSPFVNMYALKLGESDIWPRGFPLNEIRSKRQISVLNQETKYPILVVQFFINGDTDVDAVHRMVQGVRDIQFPATATVDIIGQGAFCPFNSQLTMWWKPTFPLLYLPSTVTFRFTDILRSIVAKRVLDKIGSAMGFADSIGYQIRNEHDFMQDFESEIPCYLHTRKAWDCLADLSSLTVEMGILESYQRLVFEGICHQDELLYLESWLLNYERLRLI
jgi:hypothetical protein